MCRVRPLVARTIRDCGTQNLLPSTSQLYDESLQDPRPFTSRTAPVDAEVAIAA
jgi:hypothetical protein